MDIAGSEKDTTVSKLLVQTIVVLIAFCSVVYTIVSPTSDMYGDKIAQDLHLGALKRVERLHRDALANKLEGCYLKFENGLVVYVHATTMRETLVVMTSDQRYHSLPIDSLDVLANVEQVYKPTDPGYHATALQFQPPHVL